MLLSDFTRVRLSFAFLGDFECNGDLLPVTIIYVRLNVDAGAVWQPLKLYAPRATRFCGIMSGGLDRRLLDDS
jgi:hypothetical protein